MASSVACLSRGQVSNGHYNDSMSLQQLIWLPDDVRIMAVTLTSALPTPWSLMELQIHHPNSRTRSYIQSTSFGWTRDPRWIQLSVTTDIILWFDSIQKLLAGNCLVRPFKYFAQPIVESLTSEKPRVILIGEAAHPQLVLTMISR